jgi:hypothetical protein
MTPAETAMVLTKASAFDLRTVGETDVLAWHEVLGDLDFADALEAVARYYAEQTDRLMPAHVRRLALAIDRDRRKAQREAEEREALAIEAADPTRRNRSEEVDVLLARLRTEIPEGDPDKLRRPEWVELERQRERAARAEPNPHYDPSATLAALASTDTPA